MVQKGNFYCLFAFSTIAVQIIHIGVAYRIMVGRRKRSRRALHRHERDCHASRWRHATTRWQRATGKRAGGCDRLSRFATRDTIVFHALHLPDGAAY